MRIAILSSGRFHVNDLARELDALGHEVAFYSLVPTWRLKRFGLPARCARWLAPPLAPLVAAARLAQTLHLDPVLIPYHLPLVSRRFLLRDLNRDAE